MTIFSVTDFLNDPYGKVGVANQKLPSDTTADVENTANEDNSLGNSSILRKFVAASNQPLGSQLH